MKKFLLLFLSCFSMVLAFAQPILNELYVTPGSTACNGVTRKEFFEIYSGNPGGSTFASNLGCYYLVVNWQTGAGGANNQGLYILDFPSTSVTNVAGFFTASSAAQFGTQTNTANCDFTADLNWNSGGVLKKFTATSVGTGGAVLAYDAGVVVNNVTNLFDETMPFLSVFLYNGSKVVDAVVVGGGGNVSATLSSINNFGALSFSYDCSGSINNTAINFGNITLADLEIVNPVSGTDNGYRRNYDGNCSSWEKSASPPNHTPGSSNKAGAIPSNALYWDVSYSTPVFTGTFCKYKTTATLTNIQNVTSVTVNVYNDNNQNFTYDADTTIDTRYAASVTYPVTGNTLLIPDILIPGGKGSFIILTFNSGCYYTQNFFITANCSSLPVNLKHFDATKRTNKVVLTWVTESEINNDGFEIQRRIGSDAYKTIAFIDSKAPGGNSNGAPFSYSFDDLENLPNGVTYYRLRQVDLDGKSNYSEIRAVRSNSKILLVSVYPNPSRGTTNIAIPEGVGIVDITLEDFTGKLVQRWNGINTRNLQLTNLKPGMYMLRVNTRESGDQVVERILIQ